MERDSPMIISVINFATAPEIVRWVMTTDAVPPRTRMR
jgi:hypothetical protein